MTTLGDRLISEGRALLYHLQGRGLTPPEAATVLCLALADMIEGNASKLKVPTEQAMEATLSVVRSFVRGVKQF